MYDAVLKIIMFGQNIRSSVATNKLSMRKNHFKSNIMGNLYV